MSEDDTIFVGRRSRGIHVSGLHIDPSSRLANRYHKPQCLPSSSQDAPRYPLCGSPATCLESRHAVHIPRQDVTLIPMSQRGKFFMSLYFGRKKNILERNIFKVLFALVAVSTYPTLTQNRYAFHAIAVIYT